MTAEEIMQLDEALGVLTRPNHNGRVAELDRLRADLDTARDRLCEALEEQTLAEAMLRGEKDGLAEEEGVATMDAYASGAITGKNKEERDTQIAAYVRARTVNRQIALSRAEAAMANARISRDQAETQWKAIVYQLQAMQAIVALLTDK
jgi:hypothetical protein